MQSNNRHLNDSEGYGQAEFTSEIRSDDQHPTGTEEVVTMVPTQNELDLIDGRDDWYQADLHRLAERVLIGMHATGVGVWWQQCDRRGFRGGRVRWDSQPHPVLEGLLDFCECELGQLLQEKGLLSQPEDRFYMPGLADADRILMEAVNSALDKIMAMALEARKEGPDEA